MTLILCIPLGIVPRSWSTGPSLKEMFSSPMTSSSGAANVQIPANEDFDINPDDISDLSAEDTSDAWAKYMERRGHWDEAEETTRERQSWGEDEPSGLEKAQGAYASSSWQPSRLPNTQGFSSPK